jgi:molybdopterin-containing oxidoreductase family iron-sulfur binding subunit
LLDLPSMTGERAALGSGKGELQPGIMPGGSHSPSRSLVDDVRAALAGVHGAEYWRTLEALAARPDFQVFLRQEFPSQAERFARPLERREFLRLMGASLGVAGLAACTRQPDETIVPFASTSEYTIPGSPLYFATAMSLGGAALGLLVESHMGRPTKIEGNPDHPSSLGATDAFAQAAILALYDPDRSRSILHGGRIGTWSAFTGELSGRLDEIEAQSGAGLAILHADEASPALSVMLARVQARLPRARVERWTSVHRDHSRAGAELAFGRDVSTRYRFDAARVAVALDADFLASGPGGVRYARDFARARAARAGAESFLRLYAVESSVSLSGAMADERLALRPSRIEGFARALAKELGLAVAAPELDERTARFARAAARDLAAHAGSGIVLAGEAQGPAVHALAHAINHALGNVGRTVEHAEPLDPWPLSSTASISELAAAARAGEVQALLVLGGNPVYDAPADLDFAAALSAVPFRVHLSQHVDETSRLCHWHVPLAHFLESWGDARAHDGSSSIVQPLIAPLHGEKGGGGKSALEILALYLRESASAHELLRGIWREKSGKQGADFERFWRNALHDGVVEGTTFPALAVAPRADLDLGPPPEERAGGLELAFRPDASSYDGRFANNGWLQETPRPLTRLVWDNAALLSAATAGELGVASGDVLAIAAGGRALEAPAWIVPGHPDGTLTLHLGYGRSSAGELGNGVGFDAQRLRTSDAHGWTRATSVTRSGARAQLVTVQKHPGQEGRGIVRVETFDRFRSGDRFRSDVDAGPHGHADELAPPSLYPGFPYEGYAWGMVIDLNACIGCNACMVACQAENNVPVVGKAEVARGREMHWIRIDRYWEESEVAGKNLLTLHQPLPCMHCENAPCEVVCPVGATVHSSEGLNEMVYNRCVGTRYCANNCPYKVRRFNFFKYADYETESLKLARNPDVTVRSLGVMEKCTYCVQRISQARIKAKKEERAIADGEVVSACQQACPTQAIVFGDINDRESRVAGLREEPHHYGLLAELGTRPRTTYLARLVHPNPELEQGRGG